MTRYSDRRVRLIVRKTRLDELVFRHNTAGQAKFYIESLGGSFSDIQTEHERYIKAKLQAQMVLDGLGRLETVERELVPNYIFGPDDLVVCLGQDGLVANVLKYLPTQPVLGVNPDPQRWDGLLLRATLHNLESQSRLAIDNKLIATPVRLAEAVLNDGQSLKAVNDLFIGASSHISARYDIAFDGHQERQSSSGVIVSTGLGSTGWYSSLMSGAMGLSGMRDEDDPTFNHSWAMDAPELRFTVREPFVSKTSLAGLLKGVVATGDVLTIESQMGGKGVIFSDGVEHDEMEFNAGAIATIQISNQSGWLLKP